MADEIKVEGKIEKPFRLATIHKIIISLILIGIMVAAGWYVYTVGEDGFKQKKVIRYPTGCEEVYVDGNLTTEKCDYIPTMNPIKPIRLYNISGDAT